MEPNEGPSYAHVVAAYLCNFSLNAGRVAAKQSLASIYISIYIYILPSSLAANGSRKILPSHRERERERQLAVSIAHAHSLSRSLRPFACAVSV